MQIKASSVEDYISKVPEERQPVLQGIRKAILENLPEGFEERLSYGMIGYVVPHELYPPGYHVDPKLPLPFINVASQKNFVALYHLGIYASEELLKWFVAEYPKHNKTKLDMGKSCVRLKKMDQMPYELIGELCTKMTVDEWIKIYESSKG
ncbi:MAG: DUF1801 domain-containing protein [Bacteroidota bacterium]